MCFGIENTDISRTNLVSDEALVKSITLSKEPDMLMQEFERSLVSETSADVNETPAT